MTDWGEWASMFASPELPATRRPSPADGLAYRAAADAADGRFGATADADAALAALAAQQPDPAAAAAGRLAARRIARAMASAQLLDEMIGRQSLLAADTTAATAKADGAAAEAGALAVRQAAVADRAGEAAEGFTLVGLAPSPDLPLVAAGGGTSAAGAAGASVGSDVGIRGEAVARTDVNARARAAHALASARGQVLTLRRQLAELVEADAERREAAVRASAARREADGAPPERKPSAKQRAETATRARDEAASRTATAAKPVAPAVWRALLAAVEPFVPTTPSGTDAAAFADAVGGPFARALADLGDRVADDGADHGRVEQAATYVRRTADRLDAVLAFAQEELADRDPLTAAAAYARAAADDLSRRPPDPQSAAGNQARALAAMTVARERTLRYAAVQRMAVARTLRPAPAVAATGPSAAAGETSSAAAAGGGGGATWSAGGLGRLPFVDRLARGWRRLRPGDPTDDAPAAPPADPEPPGYEAALKAYFEAVGKK